MLSVLGTMRNDSLEPSKFISYITPYKVIETIGSRPPSGYANLANILQKMGTSWNYQYGQTLFSWLVAPIPRSTWPDKPPISIGQKIKTSIYGKTKSGGGGVPTNSIGEFYINFGTFGLFYVIIWWFIGGYITGMMYITFKPILDKNPTALILYILLLFYFVPSIFLNNFSNVFINFLKVLIPTFIFISFVCTKIKAKRAY
jgi:hypothetical protein